MSDENYCQIIIKFSSNNLNSVASSFCYFHPVFIALHLALHFLLFEQNSLESNYIMFWSSVASVISPLAHSVFPVSHSVEFFLFAHEF